MDRIQSHLRRRKLPRRPLGLQRDAQPGADLPSTKTTDHLSLSLVTAGHQQLMMELIFRFGISASKAYDLVMSRGQAVQFQLEVWPLRQVAPRNRAGWMIQAIESNYEAPSFYFEHQKQQQDQQVVAAAQTAVQDCAICDSRGFRYIKSTRYPDGAMRQCSHHPTIESQYTDPQGSIGPMSDDAQNGSIRGATTENDKRPAESSASP